MAATPFLKRRQQVLKPRNSLDMLLMLKPSLSFERGQHDETASGEGSSVRPGSWSGAKAQDGSPGNLRNPAHVHTRALGTRQPAEHVPGPVPVLHRHGSAVKASTNLGGNVWCPEANQISDRNARAGSRSAFIVLTTAGNRTRRDPTEGWEAPRDENRWRETRERTFSLANLSTKRQRIAALARAKRGVTLSTLHHVIDLEWMKEAYRLTRKDGAPGIDGVTATDYATNLEAKLSDLLDRIKSGRYQAPPVRRAYIPKSDGSRRPLGLPTFEDKVAQRAIVMVLEAVYQQDFLPCSYGFRPGPSAHQALQGLRTAFMSHGLRWVVDIDIVKYFDSIRTPTFGPFLTDESRTVSSDG